MGKAVSPCVFVSYTSITALWIWIPTWFRLPPPPEHFLQHRSVGGRFLGFRLPAEVLYWRCLMSSGLVTSVFTHGTVSPACSPVLHSSAPSSLISKAYQAVLWSLSLFLWNIIRVFWLLQRILWVFFFANSLYFIVFHALLNAFILSSCFLDVWKIFFLPYWGPDLACTCSAHIIYERATLSPLLFFTLRQELTRLPRQTLNLWPFCHSLPVSCYCRPVWPAAACTTCEWVLYVIYLHT